jgi:hypothetical protein
VVPLYGCCEHCAADQNCHRCIDCGTWHHDDPVATGRVRLDADGLPRCTNCRIPSLR